MRVIPLQVEKQQSGTRRPRKKRKFEMESQVREIVDLDDEDDDDDDRTVHCKSILEKGTGISNAISVEQYSEDRDLHLTLMASRLHTKPKPNFIDLCRDDDDHDEIRVHWFNSPKTQKNPFGVPNSVTENGESSNSKNVNEDSPSFVCEICFEPKSGNESFRVKDCSHAYCSDCMARYVASKLQENVTTISCPVSGCGGSLEPEYCRSILPQEVFDRWGVALCEALILESEKFYCPYKDCSVMLIDDGKEVIRDSECPSCYRMFCAQCKVPWHEGIECEEFQKLNKDEREKEDIMLMNLAQNKHWRRCPNCRFYVERSEGCLFMQCRCGTAFCYNCGNIYKKTNVHYCSKCRR